MDVGEEVETFLGQRVRAHEPARADIPAHPAERVAGDVAAAAAHLHRQVDDLGGGAFHDHSDRDAASATRASMSASAVCSVPRAAAIRNSISAIRTLMPAEPARVLFWRPFRLARAMSWAASAIPR